MILIDILILRSQSLILTRTCNSSRLLDVFGSLGLCAFGSLGRSAFGSLGLCAFGSLGLCAFRLGMIHVNALEKIRYEQPFRLPASEGPLPA